MSEPDPNVERRALALFEAMLEVPEGERAAWIERQTKDDPAVAARVKEIWAADLTSVLRTGAAHEELEEEAPPARVGAYRVEERIGRGGMGSVYRGVRDLGDFDHVVAIKIIKPGLLSESLIDRFHRERRLLAGLVHPHIARLYDGGETEAGAPYFVMEYVGGRPLLDWVEEKGAGEAERARLFVDTCDAVAFAHRNLVIHRDLTPSNVLVTAEGKVKLIDFGIARPAADEDSVQDAEPASIASLSLTPGYAAPERMTTNAVTTASDVYSLGRILQRLFPEDKQDRDVAAIMARAVATNPQERYPSADALAADVQAWQTGLPVAARQGGAGYQLGKFVRRHWLANLLAASLVVVLIGALVVTLLANQRADLARDEAVQRFDQTRAIARALLFDAFDQVSRVPGSTQARLTLARTGLTYLDALAAQENAPVDVRTEVGLGYLRLAQVVGGGQSSQLGRFADANELIARAEGVLAPLAAAHPGDVAVAEAMAALLVEKAGVDLYNNNETDRARASAQQAQALVRDRATRELSAARLYADAMRAEGDSFLWTDEFEQAKRVHQATEAFIAGLPAAMQADPQIMAIRAANLRLLGEALHKRRETEPARLTLERSVALARTLSDAQPDDPLRRRRLATALRYQAIVHRSNERDEAARVAIEESARNATMLRDRDPSDAGALQLYAVIAEVQAQILTDLGRYPESYAVGDQVRATHERLVALSGNAAGARRSMAHALRTHGGNHYNGGDYAGACRIWQSAIALFASIDRDGALTQTDRNNAYAELTQSVARTCNPPRGALGPRI